MWWCLNTYFIVLHCLAAKYLTYKITETKFVIYPFLIHDSLLFSCSRLHFVRGLSEYYSPYSCPAKLIKYVQYIPNCEFPSLRWGANGLLWERSSYKNKMLGWVLFGCIAALQQSFCHQSNCWYEPWLKKNTLQKKFHVKLYKDLHFLRNVRNDSKTRFSLTLRLENYERQGTQVSVKIDGLLKVPPTCPFYKELSRCEHENCHVYTCQQENCGIFFNYARADVTRWQWWFTCQAWFQVHSSELPAKTATLGDYSTRETVSLRSSPHGSQGKSTLLFNL